MMYSIFLAVVALLACQSLSARAEKDSDYYYPGFANPNTKYEMYWKDSVNVLSDLDQFESLYIKYHHCVWSKYGSKYGSGEDYDEQDGNSGNNNNACGGSGGEYYWYMGRTQCFKPNVAYSLYGILKTGTEQTKTSGDYCNKATYINSFFTTFGVESFTGPLGLDIDYINSQCTIEESDDGGGNNNNYVDDDAAKATDDYTGDDFVRYNYDKYSSYGTGCSAKRTFVQNMYRGAFCHGSNQIMTVDTLDSFNEAIESMECTQIYDSGYDDDDNERRIEEDEYEFDGMDAIAILSFSKVCSPRQYPRDCPDPFGLKRKYARAIERDLIFRKANTLEVKRIVAKVVIFTSYAGGLVLFILAVFIQRNNKRLERARKKALLNEPTLKRAKRKKKTFSSIRQSVVKAMRRR